MSIYMELTNSETFIFVEDSACDIVPFLYYAGPLL